MEPGFIAATCLVNNCSLITNNIKDFDKITGLHLVKAEIKMEYLAS
jgi:predicted nucleic acid-binding protein